jgi:hypothetical protein
MSRLRFSTLLTLKTMFRSRRVVLPFSETEASSSTSETTLASHVPVLNVSAALRPRLTPPFHSSPDLIWGQLKTPVMIQGTRPMLTEMLQGMHSLFQ